MISLAIFTVSLWVGVLLLHRFKQRLTLIPLYGFLAVLAVLTHNVSDLGFSVSSGNWFFLVGSISFFTTLMLGILFVYLFEGPRATRNAMWVVLGISLFYIYIVWALGMFVDTSGWVQISPTGLSVYFWSITALIIDIVFLAVIWELLSKLEKVPVVLRVFLSMFAVYVIDTFIFATGAFGTKEVYSNMLFTNIITRLIISLVMAPIAAYFLNREGYKEENRHHPVNFWEIVNFRSDLEAKIEEMQKDITTEKQLEEKLALAQETYSLALNGVGAGVWDWDVLTNKIIWSEKFCQLIGYKPEEFEGTLDAFKKILHPEDFDRTFATVDQCFKTGQAYEVEYRLRIRSGVYRWFQANGIVKFDKNKRPIRMVGSIIDINDKKAVAKQLEEKLEELTKLNALMVGREAKMGELKAKISALEQKTSG